LFVTGASQGSHKIKAGSRATRKFSLCGKKYKQGEVESIGPYTWKIIMENIKSQMSMFNIEKQMEYN